MKKNLTIRLFLLLTLILSGFAVQSASAQMRWGAKVGANFSKIPLGLDQLKEGNMTAFHIGPMVEYDLPLLPIAIDGAVLFSQRGTTIEQAQVRELLKANYIDIPLNLKAKFTVAPTVKLMLLAGPYASFLLSHNASDVLGQVDSIKDFEAEKVGFGINAGIGVQLLRMFQVTATYGASLSKDYKYRGIGAAASDYMNAKNKTFQLSAAILF